MSTFVRTNAHMPISLSTDQDEHSYEDRVLADRFRTKMCAKFMENDGWCPYESRCMFAHGEHQLRTTEMNLQEGLVTETAIKEFKFRESPISKKGLAKKRRAYRRRMNLMESGTAPSLRMEEVRRPRQVMVQEHPRVPNQAPTVYHHDPYAFNALYPGHQIQFSDSRTAISLDSQNASDDGLSSAATSFRSC